MDVFDYKNLLRQSLRPQGKLTYCLFDFDSATMFPRSMPLGDCRLPSHLSFNALYNQVPADTSQVEFDFSPFAFDVGMMGVMFCNEFQQVTQTAPMLALLLDRMTTRNVDQRFKASEGLQFFEHYVIPLTTEDQMSSPALKLDMGYAAYDYYDRWQGLDPKFIEKWVVLRESPVPRRVQFLRDITSASMAWIEKTFNELYPYGFKAELTLDEAEAVLEKLDEFAVLRDFAREVKEDWLPLAEYVDDTTFETPEKWVEKMVESGRTSRGAEELTELIAKAKELEVEFDEAMERLKLMMKGFNAKTLLVREFADISPLGDEK
ncbi:hypothetical protein H0H87_002571 [Tephrocybe sp. NHM501043]|nr:hypothetical protein H0H87_002571 [Tephrocybe sp. NHM501043]